MCELWLNLCKVMVYLPRGWWEEKLRWWYKKVEFHGGSFARVLIRVLIRVPSETAAAKTTNSVEDNRPIRVCQTTRATLLSFCDSELSGPSGLLSTVSGCWYKLSRREDLDKVCAHTTATSD
jgi:hypothetical protein